MKEILLIGGDIRMRILAERFKEKEYKIKTRGLFENDNGSIASADIIILPIPLSRDGVYVNCPITGRFIELSEIRDNAGNRAVFGGGSLEGIRNYTDYSCLDEYALLNAVPTAEGAIAAAIQNTDFTLWKSRVLVIGFGRVGKVLSERLIGMKCNLTVSARKPSDLALIEILGADYVNTEKINELEPVDIIFNTVDYPVLENKGDFIKNSLIIDLSSKGCMGNMNTEASGAKYIKLPGIPGKTAPDTAAQILCDTISRFL